MNGKEERIREINQEIINNIAKLESPYSDIGDWKINKCYEYRLQNKPDPYNMDEVFAERDKVRAEINRLQAELKVLEAE